MSKTDERLVLILGLRSAVVGDGESSTLKRRICVWKRGERAVSWLVDEARLLDRGLYRVYTREHCNLTVLFLFSHSQAGLSGTGLRRVRMREREENIL